MTSSEVHASNVVLPFGGVVFHPLTFLAVVLFAVVVPSCVLLISPSFFWVGLASSISLVGGIVFPSSFFWVWVPSSASLRWCCRSYKIELNMMK